MPDHSMSEAIRAAYRRGEEEETMGPLVRVDAQGRPVGRFTQGDTCLFYDIRGEREIELSRTLTDPDFTEFPVTGATVKLVTMIDYDPSLSAAVAFPPPPEIKDTLCEVATAAGRRVVKVAESEKAIHIRYFLNGKREEAFPGEARDIVESARDVEDFDERPEMSVAEVADTALKHLTDPACDLLIVNFANMDVVGHIEDQEAVLHAIRAVDEQVGRVTAAAREAGVAVVVTADHGSVEKWYYPDGKVDTGHTDSPVPCVVQGPPSTLRDGGSLTDVAPTVLQLLGLPVPTAMTGQSLLVDCPVMEPWRVLLLIVDGWGAATDPTLSLLERTPTPHLEALRRHWPNTILVASGEAVGMPAGTVGNSEAGHLHIGAGRIIPSDRLRIEWAMRDGSYHTNPVFVQAMQAARDAGKALHLLGIISFYSSHGSVRYLLELLRVCAAQGLREVYIHGLLGRRGERPETGAAYIEDVENLCAELGVGQVVSVIGRHWALDREERWERVEKAYGLLFRGEGTPVTG